MDLTILVAFYAIFPNSKTIFFNFEQNLIKFQTPCEQKRVQNVLDADFCLHFFYKPGAPIQSNSKHHTVLSTHDHRTLTKAIINFGFFSQLKVTPYLTRDLNPQTAIETWVKIQHLNAIFEVVSQNAPTALNTRQTTEL